MMYDSRPKDREGEAIEGLVEQAIEVSANESRRTDAITATASNQDEPQAHAPYQSTEFRVAAAVAGVELLAIIGLISGLC